MWEYHHFVNGDAKLLSLSRVHSHTHANQCYCGLLKIRTKLKNKSCPFNQMYIKRRERTPFSFILCSLKYIFKYDKLPDTNQEQRQCQKGQSILLLSNQQLYFEVFLRLKLLLGGVLRNISSILYPCWQTAWCGCGTGFADAAVEICPRICSSTRVSQIPFWWHRPCCNSQTKLVGLKTNTFFPFKNKKEKKKTADKSQAKFLCSQAELMSNFTSGSSSRHSHLLRVLMGCVIKTLLWSSFLLPKEDFKPSNIHWDQPHRLRALPPQCFPQWDPKGMMSGNAGWVSILNDRKAAPVPRVRVLQMNCIKSETTNPLKDPLVANFYMSESTFPSPFVTEGVWQGGEERACYVAENNRQNFWENCKTCRR